MQVTIIDVVGDANGTGQIWTVLPIWNRYGGLIVLVEICKKRIKTGMFFGISCDDLSETVQKRAFNFLISNDIDENGVSFDFGDGWFHSLAVTGDF